MWEEVWLLQQGLQQHEEEQGGQYGGSGVNEWERGKREFKEVGRSLWSRRSLKGHGNKESLGNCEQLRDILK